MPAAEPQGTKGTAGSDRKTRRLPASALQRRRSSKHRGRTRARGSRSCSATARSVRWTAGRTRRRGSCRGARGTRPRGRRRQICGSPPGRRGPVGRPGAAVLGGRGRGARGPKGHGPGAPPPFVAAPVRRAASERPPAARGAPRAPCRGTLAEAPLPRPPRLGAACRRPASLPCPGVEARAPLTFLKMNLPWAGRRGSGVRDADPVSKVEARSAPDSWPPPITRTTRFRWLPIETEQSAAPTAATAWRRMALHGPHTCTPARAHLRGSFSQRWPSTRPDPGFCGTSSGKGGPTASWIA